MNKTITGKEFKDKIRGAGILLEDFAKKADVSPATASAWYNGGDIYLSTYDKLVSAYNELTAKGD